MLDHTTLCLTIGKRPEELTRTLESLLEKIPFRHIIAINDFGDRETDEAFLQHCPNGRLINLGRQLGHHPAVDYMYRHVQTEYIFHCEDDWLFTRTPDLEQAACLLENPHISCVVFRAIDDFMHSEAERSRVRKTAPPPAKPRQLSPSRPPARPMVRLHLQSPSGQNRTLASPCPLRPLQKRTPHITLPEKPPRPPHRLSRTRLLPPHRPPQCCQSTQNPVAKTAVPLTYGNRPT